MQANLRQCYISNMIIEIQLRKALYFLALKLLYVVHVAEGVSLQKYRTP